MRRPTQAEIKELERRLEARGIIEKVRNEHGNVVTKPGKDGKPQIVWMRTAKGHPLH